MSESGEGAGRPNKKQTIMIGALLGIIVLGLVLSRNMKPPTVETKQQLADIQVAVLAYAQDHGGKAPESLQVVVDAGLLPELPKDRSGNDIQYETFEEGYEVELISVGPDGKEGGVTFKRDHKLRFEIPEP